MKDVSDTLARNFPLEMTKSALPLNVKDDIVTEALVTRTRYVLPGTLAVIESRVFNWSANEPVMSKPATSVMFGVLSVPFLSVMLSPMPGSVPP